jgi:hypothetical protein
VSHLQFLCDPDKTHKTTKKGKNKMKNVARFFGLLATGILLSGCASGPGYKTVANTFTPLNPEQGRIFFYRSGSMVGAGVQPHVMLNKQAVGRAKPGGFFYVDRQPGDYEVDCYTEMKSALSFSLAKGETRYVRLRISLGVVVGHINPELMDSAIAQKQIQSCKYTGPESSQ